MGPTLRDWRHIIALAVSGTLSVPELGHAVEVVPYGAGKVPSLPCVMIQQGGSGAWINPDPGAEFRTTCLATATVTVWLITGDALSEAAADLMDDLAGQLYASRLKSVRDDPLNTGNHVPKLGIATDPALTVFGSATVYATSIPITVPLHP